MHWNVRRSPDSGERSGSERADDSVSTLVESETDQPWYQISFEEKAALVGAIGGITFGYDIGVISGALVTLSEDFELQASSEGKYVLSFGKLCGRRLIVCIDQKSLEGEA